MSRPPDTLGRRAARVLLPALLSWAALVVWLAQTLEGRAAWDERADEATLREWFDEAATFRKSLPELARALAESASPAEAEFRRRELAEHLNALLEPTRAYSNLLPMFPEFYAVTVRAGEHAVTWESPVPVPGPVGSGLVREMGYSLLGERDGRATLTCRYRLHAFASIQRREQTRRRVEALAAGLLLASGIAGAAGVALYLRRLRRHEEAALSEQAAREAERRRVLELQLAAAESQREAAELRSRALSTARVMAGSYAHNIRNLLVRPDDLAGRFADAPGTPPECAAALREIRLTLGTVNDRVTQFLDSSRRDPTAAAREPFDAAAVAREAHRAWAATAGDTWRLDLSLDAPAEALPVTGDLSHVQQALENLVFNARDACFEMRNRRLAEARSAPASERGRAVLAAMSARGRIRIAARRAGDAVILEVSDDGVGMTEEVRRRCAEEHFTTKGGDAMAAGRGSGSGLGLAFVALTLERQGARLEVESEPLRGATLRMLFPA